MLDEDIALTNAPQQTFKCRQQRCQYHASNEPTQSTDRDLSQHNTTAEYVGRQKELGG